MEHGEKCYVFVHIQKFVVKVKTAMILSSFNLSLSNTLAHEKKLDCYYIIKKNKFLLEVS